MCECLCVLGASHPPLLALQVLDNSSASYLTAFDSCGKLEDAVTAFTAGIQAEDMRTYKEPFILGCGRPS